MSSRLTITRSEATYRLAAGHPDPAAARLRLDRVIAEEVPRVLGSLLGSVLAADDPTVWLIRALDAELTCDLSAVDDQRLTTRWAVSVGRSLMTAINAGPDGEAVLRYRDRAAYLAAFVTDVASGRAWGRWQYASFDTLKNLAASSALADALLREPGGIAAVLARLVETRQLEPVVAAMTEPTAARLVAALLRDPPTSSDTADMGLTRIVVERLSGMDTAASPARSGLRMLAGVASATPALLASPHLKPSIAIATLFGELGTHAEQFLQRLATGLGDAIQGLERLGLQHRAEALPPFRELALRHPESVRELTAEVTRRAHRTIDERPERVVDSPVAALFFLLPSYLALRLEQLWDALMADGVLTGTDRPLLRYQVLSKGLGRNPAIDPADDMLRLVCGLPAHGALQDHPPPAHPQAIAEAIAATLADAPVRLTGEAIEIEVGGGARPGPGEDDGLAELDRATTAAAGILLRHFAMRLPGFGRASGAHLIANFLTGTGQVRVTPATIHVDLPPLPLAVVARMAGADGLTYELPWLARTVIVHCAWG